MKNKVLRDRAADDRLARVWLRRAWWDRLAGRQECLPSGLFCWQARMPALRFVLLSGKNADLRLLVAGKNACPPVCHDRQHTPVGGRGRSRISEFLQDVDQRFGSYRKKTTQTRCAAFCSAPIAANQPPSSPAEREVFAKSPSQDCPRPLRRPPSRGDGGRSRMGRVKNRPRLLFFGPLALGNASRWNPT
jgi:hypothetical protein